MADSVVSCFPPNPLKCLGHLKSIQGSLGTLPPIPSRCDDEASFRSWPSLSRPRYSPEIAMELCISAYRCGVDSVSASIPLGMVQRSAWIS